MINAESLEKRSPGFQILTTEQQEPNGVIASVLFLGLEESSDTEGFTPEEYDDARTDIATLHSIGIIGESVSGAPKEKAAMLLGKPQK